MTTINWVAYTVPRPPTLNFERMRAEAQARWGEELYELNRVEETLLLFSFVPASTVLLSDVLAFVAAHNPALSVEQQLAVNTETQRETAAAVVYDHLSALRGLNPDDAVYALLARMGAVFNAAPPATIDGIIDRTTAGNYITSTTQWANLTAAQRQWAILELEMIARAFQLIIARL